jgi:hypothetical protein
MFKPFPWCNNKDVWSLFLGPGTEHLNFWNFLSDHGGKSIFGSTEMILGGSIDSFEVDTSH